MADDLSNGYQYPFPMPDEDDVAMTDGAVAGRPAGVPSSYRPGQVDPLDSGIDFRGARPLEARSLSDPGIHHRQQPVPHL